MSACSGPSAVRRRATQRSRNATDRANLADAPQVLSDHPAQTRFDSRVEVVTLVQLGRGAVEQLAERGVLGQSRCPAAAESVLPFDAGERQEVVGHERGDGLRVLAFRGLLLAGGPLGLGCLLGTGGLVLSLELGEPFTFGPRLFRPAGPDWRQSTPGRARDSGQEVRKSSDAATTAPRFRRTNFLSR